MRGDTQFKRKKKKRQTATKNAHENQIPTFAKTGGEAFLTQGEKTCVHISR